MKFLCLLIICSIGLIMALPQQYQFQQNQFQNQNNKLPQITTSGGGSFKQGSVNFDVRQPIWTSPNQRHSIHGTGGYSRNWGEVNPIHNQKNYRVGVGYTLKLG